MRRQLLEQAVQRNLFQPGVKPAGDGKGLQLYDHVEMVVVVHFDSSGLDAAIATWIGWWVRIDYDSFAGLLRVSAQYAGRQVLRTAMLWSV